MKTTINIVLIALAGFVLGSCSSGLQMGKSTGAASDGIYYSPGQQNASSQAAPEKPVAVKPTSSKELIMAELEKKYTEILANNEKVDTLLYKADSLSDNPYERILSTSYRDSYERRLRGRSGNLIGNWGYYSNDYFYASAYDPYFYNVIVMGDEVWVEPYYISAMFGWPRPSFHFGIGWGYNPWYWNSWYYNPWNYAYYPYSHWGYNSWWNGYAMGYNSGYWNGYYWGNNTATNPTGYYSYGPRPGTGAAVNTGISTRPSAANINDRIRDYSDNQPVLGTQNDRQRNPNSGNQDVVATRPNAANIGRENSQNQEVVLTRPNRASVYDATKSPGSREPLIVTRPVREGSGDAATRPRPNEVVRGGGEPTRENHMPTYTRPKPASSSEYNRPARTYTPTEAERGNVDKRPAVAPSGNSNAKQPERTYSPPSRDERPASTPSRSNNDVNRSRPSNSNHTTPSNPPASRPSPPPSNSSSGSSGGSDTRTRNR